MARPVNFSAGPSVIPVEVLQYLSDNMVDYEGAGLSLIEVSHRGKLYGSVHAACMDLLRELMIIPNTHEIIFLGGGATLQFSMIPMNLLAPGEVGAYVNSGIWALKAIAEARKIGKVHVVHDGSAHSYDRLPSLAALEQQQAENTSYLHITSNETIGGLQWPELSELPKSKPPKFSNQLEFLERPVSSPPLIADMSSDILSRPIDVSRFGLLYAGTQKNMGPAGLTVVIISKNLLEQVATSSHAKRLGSYLNYNLHVKYNSLYNTPPAFSIWAMKAVLENLKNKGGLSAIVRQNETQAHAIYNEIDRSGGFYHCHVRAPFRSQMNVVWRLADQNLESAFLRQAEESGLLGLKGHRSRGGLRASIYNSMSNEGVERLTTFMHKFRSRH